MPTSFRATVSLASILGCLAIAALTFVPTTRGGVSATNDDLAPYRNIPLWEPGKVPLATGTGPLDDPFLTAFLPPEGKRNGASVVIAPGGANIMLMYGAEGLEIAERYNDWGVTAFVLTYRLSPRYGENARVLDGTRAIQLVRRQRRRVEARSGADRLHRILGRFEHGPLRRRGGAAGRCERRRPDRPRQLAARLSGARLRRRTRDPGRIAQGLSADLPRLGRRRSRTVAGNAQLFMDLTRAGAVAEMHVYQKGRHGFGSGFGSPEFGDWMSELRALPEGRRVPADAPLSMERLALPVAALATLAVVLGATAQTSKVVTDGYGDYVYVPAGAFRMGDASGDGEARERPVHVVELDAFYIAKFEMTNGEWKKFRDDPGYDDPRFWPEGRSRAARSGAVLGARPTTTAAARPTATATRCSA